MYIALQYYSLKAHRLEYVLCFSVQSYSGFDLFTADGTTYHHTFNFLLCNNTKAKASKSPYPTCVNNATESMYWVRRLITINAISPSPLVKDTCSTMQFVFPSPFLHSKHFTVVTGAGVSVLLQFSLYSLCHNFYPFMTSI